MDGDGLHGVGSARPVPPADAADARGSEMPEASSDQFDIDKWLSGASGYTVYTEVLGKPHLHGVIQRLDAELRRETDPARRRVKAEDVEAARAEMEASRVGFTFRGVPTERVKELEKTHGDDATGFACALMAEQCVEPVGMTGDHFRRLHDAWGEGVFVQELLSPANQAQQGVGVTVPFSPAASLILSA